MGLAGRRQSTSQILIQAPLSQSGSPQGWLLESDVLADAEVFGETNGMLSSYQSPVFIDPLVAS